MKAIKSLSKRIYNLFKKIITDHSIKIVFIIFLVVAVYFIKMARSDTSLANALVAFGTLILALVTALSILNSINREKRDRKERLFNEIIGWAENIIKSGYSEDIDHTKLGTINDQQQEFAYINDVFSRISTNYGKMKIKSISIIEDATYLGEELLGDVTKLSNYLFNYSEEIDYILGTSEKEKEYRYKLKYNNPEACEEIKRRMSSSREILINQPEKMDLLAEKIIKQATNMKHNI